MPPSLLREALELLPVFLLSLPLAIPLHELPLLMILPTTLWIGSVYLDLSSTHVLHEREGFIERSPILGFLLNRLPFTRAAMLSVGIEVLLVLAIAQLFVVDAIRILLGMKVAAAGFVSLLIPVSTAHVLAWRRNKKCEESKL